MNARASLRRPARRRRETGFVLVTGMLFLVVLTLLGLAMFRNSGVMDRISGNSRDKQRSFEAAESALQYAEFWLANGGGGTGTACSTLASGDTVANIHVCSNALASGYQSTVPFPAGFSYTPPNLNVNANAGMASSGDVNYQNLPGFYIENLGVVQNGTSSPPTIYQVTAYGKGGSSDTVSVVRSVYQVTPTVKSLTGL
jgi:type IV pilus assembly protein PilX